MGRRKFETIFGSRLSAVYAIVLLSFFVFPFIAAAVMYQPGETLDPSCAPTDSNCGVYPSVSLTTSTYAVGDILFASSTDSFALLNLGTNGQFLKATNTGIEWASLPGGGDLLASNDLSDVASSTLARQNLGLEIGADVQAYNAGLSSIAGLSFATSTFIVGTGAGWEAQSSSTVKTTLGISNVEDTALSTWAGSANITTLGTITSGVWNGTAIATSSLSDIVIVEGENISLLTNDSEFVTTTGARQAIESQALGLTYSSSTGQFTLTTGYEIPTTASTTVWNDFASTPSSTIALGTGLAWNSNTIQVASGYNIPLTASTTNWNTAYNTVTASSSDWQSAFSWGNHASAGYLTSYTETDPIWMAASSSYLTTSNAASTYLTQASAGSTYLTQANAVSTYLSLADWNTTTTDALAEGITNKYYADSLARGAISFSGLGLVYDNGTGVLSVSSTYNIPLTVSTTAWQTAFDWGDHASAGYLVASSNLSDLTNSSTARTNLGLGTLALQNSSGVAITGGNIDGTIIGASSSSSAMFTNVTSTNLVYSGELTTPFTQGSVLFAGANGLLSESNNGLYFDSATNRLGIGTITPEYDVEVSGSMRLWESTSTTTLVVRAGALQNLSTTPYVFEVLDSGGSRLGGIRIDGFSAAKIFSTTDSASAAISQTGAGYSPGLNLNTSNGIAWASAGQWYAAKDTSISRIAAGKVGIGTGAIGDYSGALLVGSIGINTSTPGYALTIAGQSGASSSSLYIGASSDGTSERAALTLDNWEVGQDYNADGTKDFYIKDSASSTARFFIDKQGNIGVGTTTPQSAFHLASGSFTQTVGAAPVHVGAITDDVSTSLDGAIAIYVSEDYAYITSVVEAGIEILDISDPTNPTHVGTILDDDTTLLTASYDIKVVGAYAYITSSDGPGVEILDISDPTNPTHAGSIVDNVTTALNGANSIELSGNYAYVTAYSDAGIEVLDISDPTNPTHAGSIVDGGTTLLNGANDIVIRGNYAYVTASLENAVEVLDISDPTNPTHAGSIVDDETTLLYRPNKIAISGNYAYIVTSDNALEILDISDPTNPTHASSLSDGGDVMLYVPMSIHVVGNYAYIAAKGDNAIEVVDISNPINPRHVGVIVDDETTELSGAQSIFVSGNYLYVASLADDGVEVLSIPGIIAPTANLGSVEIQNVQVTQKLQVANDVYIGNGLIVGGNSLFGSAMSIAGGLTLHDNTTSTTALVPLLFNHNTTTMWKIALDKSDDNLYIAGSSTESGVYLTQGSAGGWSTFSDQRLKENIMDLNVLDRIDNYRAVSFDWKSSGEHDVGAIAQELYEIFPEAVTVGDEKIRDGNRGAWGIQYSKLGALALEGVKELKQELDSYNALLLGGGVDGFINNATANNTLTFSQNISFTKHVSFGKDTVGSALIQAGEDGVLVRFDMPYDTPPIVNLTLASDVVLDTYFVDAVDAESFTIRIRPSALQDVMINWSAFGQVTPSILTSEEETSVSSSSSNSSGSADSLTDLANNYLSDNGLTLDDTSTTTPDGAPTETVTTTPSEETIVEETVIDVTAPTTTSAVEETSTDAATATSTESL